MAGGPVAEYLGKLVVAYYYVFVYQTGLGHVIYEPVKDGFAGHLKQGLGEVLGQGVEPGGVAGG